MRLRETVKVAEPVTQLFGSVASHSGLRSGQTGLSRRSIETGGTPMLVSSPTCLLPNGQPGTTPRDQMIAEHLPVVQFIARAMHKRLPPHVLIEDLYSAGLIGLLDALDKFVPGKNAQFRSYAQFRIRGAIVDSLRETDWGSRRLRRITRELQKAISTLTARLGREPTDGETAEALAIDLPTLHKTRCELRGLEVDWLRSTEVGVLPGRREDDPLFQCLGAELRGRLTDAIATLNEQERKILTLYYYEELKQKDIAAVLGVSESRISQILGSAVIRLRVQLAALSPLR